LSFELWISAAEPTRTQLEFFENKIRPIFVNHCYDCHSQEAGKAKGGLQLDTRDNVLKGGKTGPAIVPGYPEQSLLIKAVSYTDDDLKMPPKDKKLSDAQIADLTAWVKMGAPDPRKVAVATGKKYAPDAGKDHWAFKPVQRPPVPEIANRQSLTANPIDAFVLAKQEASGLKPNPPADKRTLIRRATFDLIGLPPTPQEVEDFVNDTSPDAFAKVVDRLLNSPHYGERWARYWLDIARYADTKGDVRRQQEDHRYTHAWTYRDYVIDSLNQDKPYDQFIIEQIAADRLLPLNATDRSKLAALGFLTLGDHFNGMQHDIINDRIDVVTRGLMGLTVSCARCHDHKFDPIPQQDYYSLHGIFASTYEPRELPALKPPVRDEGYSNYVAEYTAAREKLDAVQQKAVEMRRRMRAQGGPDPQKRRELIREGQRARDEFARLEMTHPSAPPRAHALYDAPRPRDSFLFIRGEAENRGPVVPRRFLECLSGPNRPPFNNGSGRLQLAQAIASKNNPLTARVLVNRVWQHHFGEGIVSTPDDFGTMGSPPSHLELLDWLTAEFMAPTAPASTLQRFNSFNASTPTPWSLKHLHRLILLSNTYQQSSANNPAYAEKDPSNRLLWRANVRGLDFEALRDSILAIGGKLDRTMGGRPVDLGREPYPTRRSVYGYIDRNNVSEVLYQFDFPNPDASTGKRYETIVPQQALFMMNSPLVVEAARALVHRDDFLALTNDTRRVMLLYELIVQRLPSDMEIGLALSFLRETPETDQMPVTSAPDDLALRRPRLARLMEDRPAMARRFRERLGQSAPKREAVGAWEKYAHALLQSNEASFVN
jgi:cytochrome c553